MQYEQQGEWRAGSITGNQGLSGAHAYQAHDQGPTPSCHDRLGLSRIRC